MQFKYFVALAITCLCLFVGCSSSVREETIEVKASNDPLAMPRTVLERYAAGEPMGSEATSFSHLVEEVRETDPTRAEILESGLREIQDADPPARQAMAKALLVKLQPSMQ